MFIRATAVNGKKKPVTIGLAYIALVEPYDEKEPDVKSIITMPNRVLYIAEPYEEIDARIAAKE